MCVFNKKFLLLKYLANKEQPLLLSHIQVAILTTYAGTHPYIEIIQLGDQELATARNA
jgi:hypothetical protein